MQKETRMTDICMPKAGRFQEQKGQKGLFLLSFLERTWSESLPDTKSSAVLLLFGCLKLLPYYIWKMTELYSY